MHRIWFLFFNKIFLKFIIIFFYEKGTLQWYKKAGLFSFELIIKSLECWAMGVCIPVSMFK